MYFKTSEQFLSIINRKNIFDDMSIDDEFVAQNDYTHLINPYKDLLATGLNPSKKRVYQTQTPLSYLFSLKKCDDFISLHLIRLIDIFEKRFKSALSYVMCSALVSKGYENCDVYLDIYDMKNDPLHQPTNCLLPYLVAVNDSGRNVPSSDTKAKDRIIEVISQLEKGDTQKNNSFCLNYLSRHNNLPFFIMITAFSFSDLCYLFESLTFDAKKAVYKIVFNVAGYTYDEDVIDFSRKLSNIRTIRNITHHHEPVIPFILSLKNPSFMFSIIRILKNSKQVDNCKCDINIVNPGIIFVENDYNKRNIITLKKTIELLEDK